MREQKYAEKINPFVLPSFSVAQYEKCAGFRTTLAPRIRTIYFFLDRKRARVLYVGQTKNFYNRMNSHSLRNIVAKDTEIAFIPNIPVNYNLDVIEAILLTQFNGSLTNCFK